MRAYDHRARARAALMGNWIIAALVTLLASLLTGGRAPSIEINIQNDRPVQITLPEEMSRFLLEVVGMALPMVLILVIGFVIIHFCIRILGKILEKTKLEKAAHTLIRTVVRVGLYILLFLIAASQLGIDVTGIVALFSVVTLALSLALQNLLTNVIGGFTLLSQQSFHSGDYVEIAGQSGTVQEISMAYTKLVTPDNKLVSIPNSAVVSAQIINYTITGTRRMELNVSASYDAPTQAVIDALIQAGTVDKILLDPPPFAAVVKYDTSSICYTLRLWAKTEDYWDMYFLVNQRIKDIFDSQGIAMTYPHLHVHMDK